MDITSFGGARMKISRRIAPRLFGILIATTLLVGACAPATVAPTVAPAATVAPASTQPPVVQTVVVQQTVAVPVPVTVTPAPTTASATTITFWHSYNPVETKALETTVIPAFEKAHPDITVQDQAIPTDDFHKKLLTAIA